jgi:hypothetical protein
MSDDQFSAQIGADGTATITFTPTKNRPWHLEQVSTEYHNSPSGTTAELRKNGNLITVMIASDVADSDPPVPVVPGDRMTISWAGGTSGDVVNAYIIYREVAWENL